MHCRISPRRMCNSCGYLIKISSGYPWLLIKDVKRTNMDGIGPLNTRLQNVPMLYTELTNAGCQLCSIQAIAWSSS